jgi:phage tail P2-like protein
MADLLPESATDQERAISESTARLGDVATPQRSLWDPATCPAELLPWLAWALSVDLWDESWPEARQRAVIAAAVEVHRHKGTPVAVETMCGALGFAVEVSEWPDYGGDPYKFRVVARSRFRDAAESDLLFQAVSVSKNTRSWLDALRTLAEAQGDVYVGGPVARGQHRTVYPMMRLSGGSGHGYAAGGVRRAASRQVGPCAYLPASASNDIHLGGAVRRARRITVR